MNFIIFLIIPSVIPFPKLKPVIEAVLDPSNCYIAIRQDILKKLERNNCYELLIVTENVLNSESVKDDGVYPSFVRAVEKMPNWNQYVIEFMIFY